MKKMMMEEWPSRIDIHSWMMDEWPSRNDIHSCCHTQIPAITTFIDCLLGTSITSSVYTGLQI